MLCPTQGPTGAEKEGDGGPRVCAIMVHQALADHFFFISLFWYTFSGIGTRSGEASLVEVYPWKEERVQLRTFVAPLYGGGWALYLILFLFVASQHELAGRPNGAIEFRNTIAKLIL